MQDQRTTKTCRRCGIDRAFSEFYANRGSKDGVGPYCKPCAKEHRREWGIKNADYAREWARRNRSANPEAYRNRERLRWLRSPAVQVALKARDTPCVDCGVQLPPEVMEFDHVRGDKAFTIGGTIRDRPVEEVTAEIAKCDVRCPNCHRMRHYREREQTREERAACLETLGFEQMTLGG